MGSFTTALIKIFGVILRGQTYLNALYLLLALPLGVIYFVFLVTGLSLGAGLVIFWIGLAILVALIAAWYGLAAFERVLTIGLLREQIPPMTHRNLSEMSLWQKFTATVGNPVTWKSLVYLLAKLPVGIASFVAVVTLGSLCASLIGAPLYYQYFHTTIDLTWSNTLWQPVWVIDTLPEALVACLAGMLLAIPSLHLLNGLAWLSGKFARIMLGDFSPAPSAPLAPAAPTTPVIPPSTPEAAAPLAG